MNQRVKTITTVGLLSAIAYITVIIFGGKIQLVPGVDFLKYDPKDIIIALGGFIWGPLIPVLVSVIVSVFEMITISVTGPIGCIMNILSSCAFALPAAFIYKKKRTLTSAVVGLLVGCFATITVMLLWNYLITPYHMGYPRQAVADMLIPVFLPFNALKCALNMGFTFLLYRPVTLALRKAGILQKQNSGTKNPKQPVLLWLIAALLILSCILLVLVWQGIL